MHSTAQPLTQNHKQRCVGRALSGHACDVPAHRARLARAHAGRPSRDRADGSHKHLQPWAGVLGLSTQPPHHAYRAWQQRQAAAGGHADTGAPLRSPADGSRPAWGAEELQSRQGHIHTAAHTLPQRARVTAGGRRMPCCHGHRHHNTPAAAQVVCQTAAAGCTRQRHHVLPQGRTAATHTHTNTDMHTRSAGNVNGRCLQAMWSCRERPALRPRGAPQQLRSGRGVVCTGQARHAGMLHQPKPAVGANTQCMPARHQHQQRVQAMQGAAHSGGQPRPRIAPDSWQCITAASCTPKASVKHNACNHRGHFKGEE
jgi:hypothetical protein